MIGMPREKKMEMLRAENVARFAEEYESDRQVKRGLVRHQILALPIL